MKRIILAIIWTFVLGVSPCLFGYDFKELDANGDKKMDVKEFTIFIEKVIPEKFQGFDTNKDGFLDRSEFEAVFDHDFDQVDANKDGKVDVKELTIFFVSIAPEKFVYYDRSGDGFLDEQEFLAARQGAQEAVADRPPPVKTFLGRTVRIDKKAKTMGVKVRMEGVFFPEGEDVILKEYLLNERDIRFDMSKATIVGDQEIKKGDTVRVGYEKQDNKYIAHIIQKIEKKK